ncbi:uncharacterized protein L201_003078 [Kwoniella dendrophila CBS 6074]|uniref:Uncharacterized protein n=1 Tax=Kwoniella dendrophila CBS 6074 TaxID=1295534 RepID=A0AAX4JTG1_9TREE
MSEGMDSRFLKQRAKESKLIRFAQLLDKIGAIQSQIISAAEAIRSGHTCIIELPSSAKNMVKNKNMYNGMNIHFPIIFDDGLKWLLRVRQCHNGQPPLEIQQFITRVKLQVWNY